MSALDWLLEDDVPGVAFLARTRLLGESPRSRRAAALRKKCNSYPPIQRMLAQVDRCIAAGARKSSGWDFGGNYQKYRGAYWTLIFLADLCADGGDRRIRRLCDHVLASQLDNGSFSPSETPRFEIVCLTANLLRALNQFGYGDDERVVRGYERLAERILPHGGVPCVVLEHCLHTSCKMVLPQALRCVASAPNAVSKTKMNKLRKLLVQEMLGVRVHQFVRPDVKLYHIALKKRPVGVKQIDFKARWNAMHRFRDDELRPKPGWLRFGFPNSYNPDLLEAMTALAEVGAAYDPAMEDALEHIEKKRLLDGRWNLDDSLNGKMLAHVEKKGRPSKWITLRALIALHHFGRIKV